MTLQLQHSQTPTPSNSQMQHTQSSRATDRRLCGCAVVSKECPAWQSASHDQPQLRQPSRARWYRTCQPIIFAVIQLLTRHAELQCRQHHCAYASLHAHVHVAHLYHSPKRGNIKCFVWQAVLQWIACSMQAPVCDSTGSPANSSYSCNTAHT
jgi:hypothetical protein